jgi:hypothetical protein
MTIQSPDRVLVLSSSSPPHHCGLQIDCEMRRLAQRSQHFAGYPTGCIGTRVKWTFDDVAAGPTARSPMQAALTDV